MSRAVSGLVEQIASVPKEEYEARIQKLSDNELQNYIHYIISYCLSGVGVGIQIAQAQIPAQRELKEPEPLITPEAIEDITKLFQERFTKLFRRSSDYHVNNQKLTYLWREAVKIGEEARSIAQESGADRVDLKSLSKALDNVSHGAIALAKRFNAIKKPIDRLAPYCDPTDL